VHAGEVALEQLQLVRDRRIGEADRSFEHHTELGRYLYLSIKKRFPQLTRDPVLGRVDILLDFLSKIGKNTPRSIDELLQNVSTKTGRLPIADQIADLVTSGNELLFRKYLESRQELLSRNPYRSVEYDVITSGTGHERAQFLTLWILFERCMRNIVGVEKSRLAGFDDLVQWAFYQIRAEGDQPEISDFEIALLKGARDLRNRLVHGIDVGSDLNMAEAIALLNGLLKRLGRDVSEELQHEINRVVFDEE
jgi:hypothetical protein